jgi:hypothetical protein
MYACDKIADMIERDDRSTPGISNRDKLMPIKQSFKEVQRPRKA